MRASFLRLSTAISGLTERQQRYLELMREETFGYQHLRPDPTPPKPKRRPQSSFGPRHRYEPDAFSLPCARDPWPKTRIKYKFPRAVRWPESVSAEMHPGPGKYDNSSLPLGGVASAPLLRSRLPLRTAGVGIPENNLSTYPGKYELPLPLLSGTPAYRPSTFAKGERTMSHIKPPATHAVYDTPSLPLGMPHPPGSHGYSFPMGGQDEGLPPRPTPGPGQYNPRYSALDLEPTKPRFVGRPPEPDVEQMAPPPGYYMIPEPRDDPTTVPAAQRAPSFSFGAMPYKAEPVDREVKQQRLARSRTAQELYAHSLTPGGRASEQQRRQRLHVLHEERCQTAPQRRLQFEENVLEEARQKREARAAKYAPEHRKEAEARRQVWIDAYKQKLGWLVVSALVGSLEPLQTALNQRRSLERQERAAKAILKVWRNTSTVCNRLVAEAGRERHFHRVVEYQLRDWIFRMRQRKINHAADAVRNFMEECEKASQVAKAVKQLVYTITKLQVAWRRRNLAINGRLELMNLQWERLEPSCIICGVSETSSY